MQMAEQILKLFLTIPKEILKLSNTEKKSDKKRINSSSSPLESFNKLILINDINIFGGS